MSQSYLETWLWEEYLRSLCNPNLRGFVRLGTGTYKTYPYKLLKLKNGNFLVTAGVFEEVIWNGKTAGKNFSFSGTPGTDMNVIVFLVNGRSLQIEWLDYLGQLVTSSDSKDTSPITELSNGDVVVTTYVKSAVQGNPISSKSNTNSLIMVRYDGNGNRIWSTYLDKTDNSILESRFSLVTDSLDRIHLFFTGKGVGSPIADTVGFGEFPTMEVSSNGFNSNQEEIGWAVISAQGVPIRQRYLPSNGNTSVHNAILGMSDSIILSGSAEDNFTGYTGHPLPAYNYKRPVVTKLSINSFAITNITYLGSISPSHTIGTVQEIRSGSDGIYGTGVSAGDFGTSFHPFQLYPSTTSYRNTIFSKFDWNGNLIWNQFLGSTAIDSLEIPPTLSYITETSSLKVFGFSLSNGTRYTGLSIPTSGDGINPFQRFTLTISETNGHYQSIHYETSFNNDPPGATELLQNIVSVSEACQGRLVRLKSIIEYSSEKGILELETKPATEEP
ncbi:hypothetical protein [Leptospira perdikensis]|nr:hypothetical protein [Leptospira perdikensis]